MSLFYFIYRAFGQISRSLPMVEHKKVSYYIQLWPSLMQLYLSEISGMGQLSIMDGNHTRMVLWTAGWPLELIICSVYRLTSEMVLHHSSLGLHLSEDLSLPKHMSKMALSCPHGTPGMLCLSLHSKTGILII